MKTKSGSMASLALMVHEDSEICNDGWGKFCGVHNFPYIPLDCYEDKVVDQLRNTRPLVCRWHYRDLAAFIFARQLSLSFRSIGEFVFPILRTAWHFEDNLGQKYVFGSLNIPCIQSFAFYDPTQAREFVEFQKLLLMFKLAPGAGSINDMLISQHAATQHLIFRDFRYDCSSHSHEHAFRERMRRFMHDGFSKYTTRPSRGGIRLFFLHKSTWSSGAESGYVYLQGFSADGNSDIRLIFINDKAFAIRNFVREDDFQEVGSGVIDYHSDSIPPTCVRVALGLAQKRGTQVAAFGFVLQREEALVAKVSYGFPSSTSVECQGYWDTPDMTYCSDKADFRMVEVFMYELNGVVM